MALVNHIQAAGISLSIVDDKLKVQPLSALNQVQRVFIREHRNEIILELQATQKQPATVHDLDRHAAEKDASVKFWRFLHGGVELDIASGATLVEAHDLLGCTSDDILEPIIAHDESEAQAGSPPDPMPGWQETTIRMWLDHIGETDPEIIAETINKCHVDIEAREFFLGRARKVLGDTGKVVTCGACEHFRPDKIGDGSGIGSCAANAWTPGRGMPLYPMAKRLCNDFKQREVTT
jgi:hypothetical protein